MPLVYYVPEYERDASQTPLDAERLLRLLGVSGKLTGFRYAVYMVEQVRDQPENMILITKRLYAQTAAAISDHAQLRRAQSPHAYSELLELS